MKYGLLFIAITALVTGFSLHRKGRPEGPFLLLVSALAALGFLLAGLFAPDGESRHHEALAADFDYCQGRVLGQVLAEHHAGETALLLTTPDVGEREALMHKGLREGLGDKVEIRVSRAASPSRRFRNQLNRKVKAGEEDPAMASLILGNYSLWFNPANLSALMEEVAEQVDLVISTVSVPAAKGKAHWPALAVMNGPLLQHRAMIASGTISHAVSLMPDPRSWKSVSSPPADPRQQFDLRFLLLTPDNVSTLDRQYPGLFE